MDFTILDKDGYPKEHIDVGTDTHGEIITEAKKLKLTLFLRTSDYYKDIEKNEL